jgi:signal peptidase I
MEERLPGQASAHEIYDSGWSPGDDFGPVTVQAGHLFLLGDNRDDSNDSRFPRESDGLGQVSLDRVRGTVESIYRPE